MSTLRIESGEAGMRLDAALARRMPEQSRARWQQLIRESCVTVNGRPRRASHPVGEGDQVAFHVPPPAPSVLAPEPIPLETLFEDASLIVINKPPGLVVHPAPGHPGGTLVNALLHHCGDLAGIGGEQRPGIVHRLDRDTSGALVAAKTEKALRGLVDQFKQRRVRKEYLALVWGQPSPAAGRMASLIGRHPGNRKKMAERARGGKPAVTTYRTVESFAGTTLLRVCIETGRTHQIRVHLASRGHAVVGDQTYGRQRGSLPRPAGRQMLHAASLAFAHPDDGRELTFEAPLAPDMAALIEALREETGRKGGGAESDR